MSPTLSDEIQIMVVSLELVINRLVQFITMHYILLIICDLIISITCLPARRFFIRSPSIVYLQAGIPYEGYPEPAQVQNDFHCAEQT